jgi:hypothetical protein
LRDIANVLSRHRDASGRAPVMSLAVVLAVPDGPALRTTGGYRRAELDDARFAPIVESLRNGQRASVFYLQLHGHEHYWPPTLMSSADANVVDWLGSEGPAATERLPSHLQSRWTDASRLPSSALADAAVSSAVADEVRAFCRIVGARPMVVVPPTFVWTLAVERAWAREGVEFVVTPGWRYTRLDARGAPSGDEGPIANGDCAATVTYLVRSDYFEPVRGRDAAHALAVLDRAAAEGRACLLENHRDNFIGNAQTCRQSLDELDKLIGTAIERHPKLRFLSTRELGSALRDCDPLWVETGLRLRLRYVWRRLSGTGRLWKLMVLTGMATMGGILIGMLSAPSTARAGLGRS